MFSPKKVNFKSKKNKAIYFIYFFLSIYVQFYLLTYLKILKGAVSAVTYFNSLDPSTFTTLKKFRVDDFWKFDFTLLANIFNDKQETRWTEKSHGFCTHLFYSIFFQYIRIEKTYNNIGILWTIFWSFDFLFNLTSIVYCFEALLMRSTMNQSDCVEKM